MNRNSWGPEEVDEYDTICAIAWESSDRQAERVDKFVGLILDAEQAHKFFASDVLREVATIGHATLLKSWNSARNRIAFRYDGKLLSKPRVGGTPRKNDDGSAYAARTLFDFMTREELQSKRREFLKMEQAYTENVDMLDRYIALCDSADANTPAEAADILGTTVEEWMTAA